MKRTSFRLALVALLSIAVLAPAIPAAGDSGTGIARVASTPDSLELQALGDVQRLVLTVSGPDGVVMRRQVDGDAISFSVMQENRERLADGQYTWELVAQPRAASRNDLTAVRGGSDGAAARRTELTARAPMIQSGSFRIVDGALVGPGAKEQRPLGHVAAPSMTHVTAPDQVIADDLIVQGSACIGLDCVNNESFGFDTIRMKENNTRIKFEDTSTGTGFPTHDWQLTANDSASGGAEKFSIEDITAATVPFTVAGSSPTNSIFVDGTGRVGFRTATPVLDLHVATGNTPAMRLEQNGSGGFTAQTWDIAGNEANFFVRDVTGGSRLPFRIRPGAPTSSIDINASGNVGVGTASPSRSLDISRAGVVDIGLVNTSTVGGATVRWFLQTDNDTNKTFKISREGGGGPVVTVDSRQDAHGVTFKVDGSIQATNVVFSSSRTLKEGFAAVDPQDVLAKLGAMPITQWRFKDGPDDVRHIGPMAEDFQSAFGLTPDGKTISVTDTSGVALAAIKGLLQRVSELENEVRLLRAQQAAAARPVSPP